MDFASNAKSFAQGLILAHLKHDSAVSGVPATEAEPAGEAGQRRHHRRNGRVRRKPRTFVPDRQTTERTPKGICFGPCPERKRISRQA
ncbi:MAG: hypothetical protein PVH90_11850, partial [Gammaproteobacteria bacterium]